MGTPDPRNIDRRLSGLLPSRRYAAVSTLNPGGSGADGITMVVCVIPAFRAADSLAAVIYGVLEYVDRVVVVDDACPQESGLSVRALFATDSRVEVLTHNANRGVGGAMKTGVRRALQLGAEIVIKVDADGQMDPAYIPEMVAILRGNPRIALVKGNRFGDSSVARSMPAMRLFGNSALTLLVRMSSGYWNGIDPTNGFLAIRATVLSRIKLDRLADRFYFEISLLQEFGLRRFEIADLEMPPRYGEERSTMSLMRVATTFPVALFASLCRRILWQYLIADMNVGSLFLLFGTLLTLAGAVCGAYSWATTVQTGIARTPGTVSLALLPIVMGFQLLLSAVLFDVQSATRTYKFGAQDAALRRLPLSRPASSSTSAK